MSNSDLPLPDLDAAGANITPSFSNPELRNDTAVGTKTAADLEHVLDVPVHIAAVLGRTKLDVGELMQLAAGQVLELDRKVGEAIDIYVNDRLVARGEVVLVDEKLGVTMTEIIKSEK
jgi:flagellar motor switch protein FliN/FliY